MGFANNNFLQNKTNRCIATLILAGLFLYSLFDLLHSKCPFVNLEIPPIRGFRPKNLEPLTFKCNADSMGNAMCTLAVLYGLSVLNNRSMRLTSCTYEKLEAHFDLNISVIDEWNMRERHPWKINLYLEGKDAKINEKSNVLRSEPRVCSFTFYNHVREQVKSLFKFKPEIQLYAQNILEKARGKNFDATLVGVHVRRPDYMDWDSSHWLHSFKGRSVDLEYFHKATNYYKKKYHNVLFVAVSDDREWCRENLGIFGIQVLEDAPSPAHDLATLANCNHTIMTYGMFGFWGGYLAGGEVVYFDMFLDSNTPSAKRNFMFDKMYLPEWVGIETPGHHEWIDFDVCRGCDV